MPINIQLNNGKTVSFPDGTSHDKINKILDEDFPITGEDVAIQIAKDPNYKPSQKHFNLYDNWLKETGDGFVKGTVNFLGEAASNLPDAALRMGKGIFGFLNPMSYAYNGTNPLATLGESAAQGTRNLYGVIAESQNPDSPLFKVKDWITGDGTQEHRRKQFEEAREFMRQSSRLEEGKDEILPGAKERANIDVVKDLSLVTDPTLMFGPIKELALAGRLGTTGLKSASAIDRVASLAGKTVASPILKGIEKAGEAGAAISEITDKIPKSGLVKQGVVDLVGIVGKAADVAGEVASGINDQLGKTSRLGLMDRVAATEGMSDAAKLVAKAGSLAEPAISIAGTVAKGALESAAVGGTLGYLNTGTAEGAGASAGAAAGVGGIAALAGRAARRMSGNDPVRIQAIAEDVNRELARMPESERLNAAQMFGRFMDSGHHNSAAEMIDVRNFIGDSVPVRFLNSEQAKAFLESKGIGYVPSEGFTTSIDGKHSIVINTDLAKPGTGFHELLHGLMRSNLGEEFGTKMADWAQSNLPKDRIEKYVNDYVSRIKDPVLREKVKQSINLGTTEGKRNALEEVSADEFSRFLSSKEHRDFLLRGGRKDLGGAFIGIAKNVLAGATDRLGITSVRLDRGFESIAKDLVKARRGIVPNVEVSIPETKTPVDKLSAAQRWRLENERFDRSSVTRITKDIVAVQGDISKNEVSSGVKPIPFDLPDKSPDKLANWAQENNKDSFLKRDNNGNVIGLKTEAEYEAERKKSSNSKFLNDLRDEMIKGGSEKAKDGSVTLSPMGIKTIYEGLSPEDKATVHKFRASIQNRTAVMVDEYLPQLKKKDNSQVSVVGERGMKSEMVAPYEFAINKDGDLYVRALDLNMIKNRANHFLTKDNFKHLKEWDGDISMALNDVDRYAENLGSDNPIPSEQLLGSSRKRDIIYKIFGGVRTKDSNLSFLNEPSLGENTYSERQSKNPSTIGVPYEGNHTSPYKSLRIDRVGNVKETGQKVGWNVTGYERHKINWKPSYEGGDIQNGAGMRIIHGNNWRLYGVTGSLIGVYSSESEAKRKADKVNGSPKNTNPGRGRP